MLFDYFFENDLSLIISQGLNPEIHILISCYLLPDEGYETRGLFLDISKAFDKFLRKGLFHKLKENDASGNILNT